nr:hypothetical protein [Tanacetum cinerariifolium]
MSSITAQQAKLDLELVPKEKRLEIEKFNERLNPGKIQIEPTFQVILVTLGRSIHSMMLFLITCINFEGLLLLSSIKVYLERQLVMTSFVSPDHKSFEMCTIRRMWTMLNYFGKISFTKLTTKPTKSKRRCTTLDLPKLSFITSLLKTRESPRETRSGCTPPGATPPKKARKFKKPASLKLTTVPSRGVVIRETLEMPLTKKKEKVDVIQGSESNHEENEEDEDDGEEVKDEFVKTSLNDSDDKAECVKDEEMDYTTSYDDVDIRLNEPVDTDKGPQTPTLLLVHVSVISDSSQVFSTFIPQSLTSFTPPSKQLTSTPTPTTEATNPPSSLPDFTSVFQFNNRVTTLEKVEQPEMNFVNFLTASITARVTEQVKNQLPQILPKEVSNFAPPVIQSMVTEPFEQAVLAKESSQPQSSYEDARSTSKDAKPAKCLKAKESQSVSSKGDKSQSKSSSKSVQSEEPKFEVADLDMPQAQEEYPGNDNEEPKEKVASKCQPQEPINPDWNVGNTPQQGQNQRWLMTLASSTEKPSKTFDELISTSIDFFAFIMNGQNINNLTQETLLGPAFRLLKATRSNYAELEYDFKECYKALLEKLD